MGSAALFWGSCCLCCLLRSGHIPGALAGLEHRDARNYLDSPSPVLGLIALARVIERSASIRRTAEMSSLMYRQRLRKGMGISRTLQVYLASPPFQKFLEELPLPFNIGPRSRVRFFRSIARTRPTGRIRRAHRRDFGRCGGAGLLASTLRGYLKHLLFSHQT